MRYERRAKTVKLFRMLFHDVQSPYVINYQCNEAFITKDPGKDKRAVDNVTRLRVTGC